jgi:dipeptidyl aminopeptidase/acylaminoacyl peptidase
MKQSQINSKQNNMRNITINMNQPVSALVLMLSLSVLASSSHAMNTGNPVANVNALNALNAQKTTIAQAVSNPVADKKIITHDMYANWRSIQGSVLSRDGQWLAYALVGQESDGEVVIKNIVTNKEWRHARGNNPVISHDGKYVAFSIAPTRAELDKAKKDKTKPEDMPKPSLGLMDLSTGKTEVVERVKRFAFPEENGNWLAVLLEPAKEVKKETAKDEKTEDEFFDGELIDDELTADADQARPGAAGASGAAKKKEGGTELIVWDLANAKKHNIKDVMDAVWSKDGSKLAYSVSIKEPTKEAASKLSKEARADYAANEGAYVFMTADASSITLLQGEGNYKQMSFDEAGKQLAFVADRDAQAKKKKNQQAKMAKKSAVKAEEKLAEKSEEKSPETEEGISFNLYYWNDTAANAQVLVSPETVGMTAGWAASEHGNVDFSKDGQRLFLGTAEIPKVEPKNTPDPMKVDLWHWKDPELQPMQKVRAEREKNRHYLAVVQLADKRFVQLANKNLPDVIVNDNARYAMGISNLPYRQLVSWDGSYVDAYTVDLQTGQAKQIIEKSRFMPSLSPSGKYIAAFDANTYTWFSYANEDGKKSNLTGKIKVRFEDVQRDTPDLKNAYGVAGWTADDSSIVLYDQFDLWEVNLSNQSHRNLTAGYGRQNKLELRYVNLEAEKRPSAFQLETGASNEKKALPSDTAWILSATHDVNKSTGYYKLDVKAGTEAAPTKLIHADKLISGLIKSKDSNTVVFTQQSFVEFPDLWSADLSFSAPQKISYANPQQAQYNWGTQEMVTYTSKDGKKLKALIAKPENFDPKKKYPMMVYIYENMTDNMYRFVPPSPGQNINVTRYVSNGYIVMRPDIVYKTGYPGKSAMNTVLPAVEQTIARGYVDAKRVGIQGHSWGAYQISYLITRTNMFRAAEAGASMANMVSGYGGIRWGTGMSRAFQYEKQQSRIGCTPWDCADKYVENSPIFQIDKVQTPYLTVHNDDDDAVPWYQAIEYFSALRRLNKEAYWFNYNGEKHGLRDRDNIKHFTVHMSEFFDHYLLNKPRPEWMDKPVPYLEKGKRDVMGMFKPNPANSTEERKEQMR